MHFPASLFVAAIIGLAQAQTPSGFKPQIEPKLEVIFNSTMVKTAGQQLTESATEKQPQLALSSGMVSASETYMFVMLDLDVPPANGTTTRRVLLHCMNTDFKATQQQVNGAATLLASSQKGPAPYFGPGPPPSDTVAHRYVQLLFQQPSNLSVKASDFASNQDRINFDVEAFMAKNGVSAPIAANFFRVDGRANAGATGTATGAAVGTATGVATGTGFPRSSVVPFEGVAGDMNVPYGVAGLLSGLALFAM